MSSNTPRDTSTPYQRSKVPMACVSCQKRKTKCTGIKPCDNCRRTRSTCEFAKRPQKPRRPRHTQETLELRLQHITQTINDLLESLSSEEEEEEIPTSEGILQVSFNKIGKRYTINFYLFYRTRLHMSPARRGTLRREALGECWGQLSV